MAGPGPHPGSLIPPGFDPYPLDMLRSDRDICLHAYLGIPQGAPLAEILARPDPVADQPAGTPAAYEEPIWTPAWLPIAGDSGGDRLLIDLRGGPLRGCVMAQSRYAGPTGPVWSSVAQMLTAIADAFTTRTPVNGLLPDIDDTGSLFWE